MSEQNLNTTCRICGKRYYSCRTCSEINHWKAVACSPEHFIQYVELVTKERTSVKIKNDKKVVVETTGESVQVDTTTKDI